MLPSASTAGMLMRPVDLPTCSVTLAAGLYVLPSALIARLEILELLSETVLKDASTAYSHAPWSASDAATDATIALR